MEPSFDDPIRRVADHFRMMLIAYAPNHDVDQYDSQEVVSDFSASGASDALTVDDIRAFLKAVSDLPSPPHP